MLCVLVNGFTVGAAMNYTLAHVLHLTLPETHFIVTALIATFRGFAGSFGSAVGGGIFGRALSASLRHGFKQRGMDDENDLIRRLMGSPALVSTLKGAEKEVAIQGYTDAIRTLWLAAAGMAALTIFIQVGTGWRGPKRAEDEERTEPAGEPVEDVIAEEAIVVQEAGQPGTDTAQRRRD